jgi:predicted nucleic acid-binding protein
MTKVVVDANVIVSGILKAGGKEAAVLNLVANGTLILCVSATF